MNQLKTAFWLTLLTVLLLAAGKALGSPVLGPGGAMYVVNTTDQRLVSIQPAQ